MRIKDQWNEQRIYSSRTFAAILIIGVLSLTLLGKQLEWRRSGAIRAWPVVSEGRPLNFKF